MHRWPTLDKVYKDGPTNYTWIDHGLMADRDCRLAPKEKAQGQNNLTTLMVHLDCTLSMGATQYMNKRTASLRTTSMLYSLLKGKTY